MKLVYPHEFKMNSKTLKEDVEYTFGKLTGSVYYLFNKDGKEKYGGTNADEAIETPPNYKGTMRETTINRELYLYTISKKNP